MGLLIQPQEIEVWYVLPAIRRELAKAMKQEGKSQKEIAHCLGVTEAAVSNYMNVKRAKDVVFNKAYQKEVSKAAASILENRERMIPESQRLLKLAWKHNLVCQLHKAQCADLPKNCKLCIEANE